MIACEISGGDGPCRFGGPHLQACVRNSRKLPPDKITSVFFGLCVSETLWFYIFSKPEPLLDAVFGVVFAFDFESAVTFVLTDVADIFAFAFDAKGQWTRGWFFGDD